jgi:hypothetical protein
LSRGGIPGRGKERLRPTQARPALIGADRPEMLGTVSKQNPVMALSP